MNAKLRESTVKRIEETTERPISRGIDRAVNDCLDQLDSLKETQHENSIEMTVCDTTKKEMEDNA